jgi:hypothetical protein
LSAIAVSDGWTFCNIYSLEWQKRVIEVNDLEVEKMVAKEFIDQMLDTRFNFFEKT